MVELVVVLCNVDHVSIDIFSDRMNLTEMQTRRFLLDADTCIRHGTSSYEALALSDTKTSIVATYHLYSICTWNKRRSRIDGNLAVVPS